MKCTLSLETITPWSNNTKLQNNKLKISELETLLELFLAYKGPKDTFDVLNYSFVDMGLNINTIKRYFSIFCDIVLAHYGEQMNYLLLNGEIEIDESHIYKQKNSTAPHHFYKSKSI